MGQYCLRMPGNVYCGEGALSQLRGILSGYQAAVFTDKGIEKAGLLDEPVKYMKEAGVDTVILANEPPSEPTRTLRHRRSLMSSKHRQPM